MPSRFTHVREGEAPAQLAGLFRDARRCLRSPWAPLFVRMLAAHGELLRGVWPTLRRNLTTRAFEESADELRAHFAIAASELGTPLIEPVLLSAGFDVDELDELREVVDAFHYVDPKLLLCTSALVECARGRVIPGRRRHPSLMAEFEPGEVPSPPPGEPLAEEPGGVSGEMFRVILATTHLPVATLDLRILARHEGFFESAWPEIAPVFAHRALARVLSTIEVEAREAVYQLPHPIDFSTDENTLTGLVALRPSLELLLEATLRLSLLVAALKVSLDGVEDALGSPQALEWEELDDDRLD